MSTRAKFVLAGVLGGLTGITVGCVLDYDNHYSIAKCWCGEQWRVQITGASA